MSSSWVCVLGRVRGSVCCRSLLLVSFTIFTRLFESCRVRGCVLWGKFLSLCVLGVLSECLLQVSYVYIYTHTYIHVYIYTCRMRHRVRGSLCSRCLILVSYKSLMCIYTYVHIYIYTYINIFIYTYTHIYTYTYIHIYMLYVSSSSCVSLCSSSWDVNDSLGGWCASVFSISCVSLCSSSCLMSSLWVCLCSRVRGT